MILKILTVGAGVLAIFIGATLQGITSRLGLFRFLGHKNHQLLGLTKDFTPTPWGYTYLQLQDECHLTGKKAIVTGANSGVGYYAALHLARQGADVTLACRSPTKCENAANAMKKNLTSSRIKNRGSVHCMKLDTSSLGSVRKFAASYLEKEGDSPLDIFLMNAGIGPRINETSVDGIEIVFATNHVGHQLLYELLQPNILQAAEEHGEARVVLTSSCAHYDATDLAFNKEGLKTSENEKYARSKLAQVLFAQEVTRQLDEKSNLSPENKALQRVFVNAAHPGFVATNIFEPVMEIFSRDDASLIEKLQLVGFHLMHNNGLLWEPEEGALTLLYLAAAPEISKSSIRGRYFHPQAFEAAPNPKLASNETLQIRLYSFTQSLYDQD